MLPSDHLFFSERKEINYKPEPVEIASIITGTLTNSSDKCPITSSVMGTTPENLATTGALSLKFSTF